jgi:hypothetical protein
MNESASDKHNFRVAVTSMLGLMPGLWSIIQKNNKINSNQIN